MRDPKPFSTLANPKRLQVLEWLKDPEAHFPPQRDGDLVEDAKQDRFLDVLQKERRDDQQSHFRYRMRTLNTRAARPRSPTLFPETT